MTRPLRKDASERRSALLAAAAELLAEQGLDVPLELIAERAGVGRATLYRNFADRTQLALAVLSQQVEELAGRTAARGDDPAAFLEFIEDLARLSVRNAGFSGALRLSAPDALAPLRARLIEAWTGPLRRAQAAGRVRGDLQPADLPLVSSLMGAALGGPEAERPAVMRRVLELIIDGLRARP